VRKLGLIDAQRESGKYAETNACLKRLSHPRIFLLLIALSPVFLFAKKGTIEKTEPVASPWFTGSLICPSANTIDAGSYNIEPYLYVTDNPAIYDNDWHANSIPPEWTIEAQIPVWVGLTNWCDIEFQPTLMWNHKQGGGGAWALGDILLQFDFQLWRDELPHKSWLPTIKFAIRESIPVGKYRNLNPLKRTADQGGYGTWATGAQLIFGRLFYFSGVHFLNMRLALQYNFYHSLVHVKGYDAYGGGIGANGKIRPGSDFAIDLGLEYSLSRHWALALDLVGYWQAKAKFTGYSGTNFLRGTPTAVAKAADIQYSIAPGIEYNWNENLGIITGAWFTVAGKQISEFYSFIFAVNYYK